MKPVYLGIDIGSVSVNLAVVDEWGQVTYHSYTRHKGQPLQTVYQALKELDPQIQIAGIAATGSGGKLVAEILNAQFVNEIIAVTKSTALLYPQIRTIIELGGEDSKLILLESQAGNSQVRLADFATNTICAAGTGSFLDQQAHRLGISIEKEFGELALKSKNPPRIAGRCSVFAKSDMIHLQQIGTPDYDIVAGLCYAVARSFKSVIGRGKSFTKPIAFYGGVAANDGMVTAFESILELEPEELFVPEYYASMGAIGAATSQVPSTKYQVPTQVSSTKYQVPKYELNTILKTLEQYLSKPKHPRTGWKKLQNPNRQDERMIGCKNTVASSRPSEASVLSSLGSTVIPHPSGAVIPLIDVFLGVDIGSISTNVVLIDRNKNVIARRYLMTAGRPIEAVRQGISEIGDEVGNQVRVCGAGTTGSGRYLIADFIGADVVRNEITAQATAAIHFDKSVDTIFEIGGQDSKYISLDNGVVIDFEMNKVCAAGTGSFLEEQAEKLGLQIKQEFGNLALTAEQPAKLGERCTVFIETDLIYHQQDGAAKPDLVAGLSYAIVYNYLNKVVGDKRVGNNIFFQGGVAANQGVVAAFEQVTGKKITVPPHHDVTGAIGVAILAMESMIPASAGMSSLRRQGSNFKGFDLAKRKYELSSFTCNSCTNYCEINRVSVEGEPPLFYGSRCEKYDVERKKAAKPHIPDYFAERDLILTGEIIDPKTKQPRLDPHILAQRSSLYPSVLISQRFSHSDQKKKVGLPRILHFYEYYPFWQEFFIQLGCEVVLSDKSNTHIIHEGIETVAAETCFPVKLAHGHILNLLQKKVDYLFLPNIINLWREPDQKFELNHYCPYVQSFPHLVYSGIDFDKYQVKVLQPIIHFQREINQLRKSLSGVAESLDKANWELDQALLAAAQNQENFYHSVREAGKKAIQDLAPNEKMMVIVSRSYNGCDPGLNLEIPRKLAQLEIKSIPLDFLPLHELDISDEMPEMYWRTGQRILTAAEYIRHHPNLYALYLTNFSCGPDSFITHFFKEKMKGKPYLQIEVDEHSADAGIITRCEAFLDSLRNYEARSQKTSAQRRDLAEGGDVRSQKPEVRGRKAEGRKPQSKLDIPNISVLQSNGGRTVYLPYMCDHAFAVRGAFRAAGIRAEVMPVSDDLTLEYGRKHTSGRECFPCIVTTGDIVKMVHQPGFKPEQSAFFMPAGDGPCRFGQYNVLQQKILRELGFPEIPFISPTCRNSYNGLGQSFRRAAWQGIVAIDLLLKVCRHIRPYEQTPGESDTVYRIYLDKIAAAIESKQDLKPVLKDAKDAFRSVRLNRDTRKPLIGVIGEIFLRWNRFSNQDLVRKLESLGAEVNVAPMMEWIYYTNFTNKRNQLSANRYGNYLGAIIQNWVQKQDEKRYASIFLDEINDAIEPDTDTTIEHATQYLHPDFEGEAILSIGKSMEYIRAGIDGIVNAIPFTCMPGTVVQAINKRLKQRYPEIPLLTIAYDGTEIAAVQTQMEAFIYQAKTNLNKSTAEPQR
ncbi:MAG: acyl-CoA dehydratase activase [bacterium]